MAHQELQQSCSPCQSWTDLRTGQWLGENSFGRFWERFPHYWGDEKTRLLPFPSTFSISIWTFKLSCISGSWGESGWNKTNTGQEQSQKNHGETNSEPDTLLLTILCFCYTKEFSSWLGKPVWVRASVPHTQNTLPDTLLTRATLYQTTLTYFFSPSSFISSHVGISKLTSDVILISPNPKWAEGKRRQCYAQLYKGNIYSWFPPHG